ncbi:MAG: sporulation protein YunB [Clostridiales bacterium]|nr:sporulation protein YunB [Clostridiales bacterium]
MFLFIVSIISSVIFADRRLSSQIRAIAFARSSALAQSAVNSAVAETLSSGYTLYDGMISVIRNSDGNVTSVETDPLKVNLLKARICSAVESKISGYNKYDISIPAGYLTGIDILSGFGPFIHVKTTMTGFASCGLKNSFTSAGINQTLHNVMLTVSASVYITFPGCKKYTTVNTEFCIAETVIVGAVPDFYADISG